MFNKKKATYLVCLGSMFMPQIVLGQTMGKVNATSLNVRKSATTSATVISKVYERDTVKVVDLVPNDFWYKVDISGKQGYVKGEYLTLTKADGTVTASSLNIRSYPDTQKSKVIGSLKNGTKVDVIYKVKDFYKIMLNGHAGFVHSSYINCKYDKYVAKQDISKVGTIASWTGPTSNNTTSNNTTNNSTSSNSTTNNNTSSTTKVTGDQIVSTAKQYLGNPYVYGGTSLTNGTDCSGFTQAIMKKFGINIPRTSSEQSKFGKAISRSELQKGDLLFFGDSTSAITHCGIYIGDGQMIHASTPKTGIIISGAYSSGGKAGSRYNK